MPESTGVTTFVQEACTAVAAVDTLLSHSLFPVQTDLQDIRRYFSRPVCVVEGVIPTGVRSRVYVLSRHFADYLTYWTTGRERLLGAYGFRATIVYTLQVAATPFHQGLLSLNFQYGVDAATTLDGVYARSIDSCTSTNIPHVVLDLSSDSMVQLKLPYLAPQEYNLVSGNDGAYAYGTTAINTLVPTPAVAGMGDPTYQLFVHFEDLVLFGATPQKVASVVLQAGKQLGGKAPVTEEFEKMSHPFSSGIMAFSRAVGFIAKGVPSLSSIGGTTSWVLGHAAGLIRYFGYSKPAISEPMMRMLQYDNIAEWQTDLATPALVVAATSTNTTSINNKVGYSDVDEMSLAYICSRWSQINQFDFDTTAPAGNLLYVSAVSPLAYWFRSGGAFPARNRFLPISVPATANAIQPSHLMFAASSFKHWRGGIKYRFTVAKTKMHAGRLFVAFNPSWAPNALTTIANPINIDIAGFGTVGVDPFGYSAIFDLKDGNIFEFEVPFISPVPYANISASIGSIALYVVNPILAPSIVSNSVSVLVEVCGMSDFELANPVGIFTPVHNAGTIALQAGKLLSEAPLIVDEYTMGEVITSVKQLITIPHSQQFASTDATRYLLPPWFYMPRLNNLVNTTDPFPAFSFSYGGNWASCYGFLKGGTDVNVYSPLRKLFLSISQNSDMGFYNTSPAFNWYHRGLSNTPIYFSGRDTLHARLPGFFPTSRVYSWAANHVSAFGIPWGTTSIFANPLVDVTNFFFLGISNIVTALGTEKIKLDRNAADDAQMAMYIGPPPIYLPSNGNSTAYGWDTEFVPGNILTA